MNCINYKADYFNAIVYCSEKEGRAQTQFLKFHAIKNNDRKISGFCNFLKKSFPSVQYVNFYDKRTKNFVERIYLV